MPPVTADAPPAALAALPPGGGTVHATTVAANGRALLICGPSGSGKSATALALMGLGAALVADDRTRLDPVPGHPPLATAPPGLPHAIEARGVGLLAADLAPAHPVAAVLDLALVETQRLPQRRYLQLFGHDVALLHNVALPHFPAALMQYLARGFAPI